MLISIRHVTHYRYAEPVTYAIQSLRLTPASFNGQRVIDWRVKAAGAETGLTFNDGFGNAVHLVANTSPHQEAVFEAGGTVETEECDGIVTGLAKTVPPRVFLRETDQTRPDEAIRGLAADANRKDVLDRLHAVASAVRDRVDYVTGITDAHTGAAEALADGKGVCQDHANIFISAVRSLGVPARYITGYLVLDNPAPADAHHAWAEAWVDGLGWVAFDVANRICTTERYVRLAAGLDAGHAAPIVGSRRGGGGEELDVSVVVQQQQQSQQQ